MVAEGEDLNQFFTSEKLARKFVDWAMASSLGNAKAGHITRVLEPSAGDGGLVRFIPDLSRIHLTACELDPRLCNQVRTLLAKEQRSSYLVHEGDFLGYAKSQDAGSFDVAIMNPPYGEGRDGDHTLAAARISRRCCALLRTNFEHGKKRFANLLRWAKVTRRAVLVRRPRFYGPSDKGHHARHEYVAVELVMRGGDRLEYSAVDMVQTEYWHEAW